MCFIGCMLLNPDVQRRAQQEIDEVVGNGRLPDFSDRDSLPYVGGILKETLRCVSLIIEFYAARPTHLLFLRWHPAVLPSVPHKTMAEDEYRGMYIPKGAMVIANTRYVVRPHILITCQ